MIVGDVPRPGANLMLPRCCFVIAVVAANCKASAENIWNVVVRLFPSRPDTNNVVCFRVHRGP